jgi:hypothetical protein
MPDELKMHKADPDQMIAAFNAATTADERSLLTRMLLGYEDGLKIKCSWALNDEGDKVSHIVCQYPLDIVGLINRRGPPDQLPERLAARGCLVSMHERHGEDVLTVAWPMAEAVKLAKIWRDDADTGEVTHSFVVPTPRGVITGTLEPM